MKLIEKLKKQNKGFTLVEIIAVIVILALIMILIVPNALKTSDSIKVAALESKKENIVSAAVMFGNDREELFDPKNGCISVYSYEYVDAENEKQVEQLIQKENDNSIDECYSYIKIKVKDLADDKYIKYDEQDKNGNNIVSNPADSENNLNNDYIYVYKKNERVYAVYKANVIEREYEEEPEETKPNVTTTKPIEKEPEETKPETTPEPICFTENCIDKEEIPKDLEIKKEPVGDCVPSSTTPVYTTYSQSVYNIKCSGKYRIEYAGGAGGTAEKGWLDSSSPSPGASTIIYAAELNLSKNLPITSCPGRNGITVGTCSNADVKKDGSTGRCGDSYPPGAKNTCNTGTITAGNGGNGKPGTCVCDYRNAGDWGPWYATRGSGGSGGAATYLTIPVTTNSDGYIKLAGNGGAGGGGTGGSGGSGGTLSSKNTAGVNVYNTGRRNSGTGFVRYYLLEPNDDEAFVMKENCKTTQTLLIDSNDINKYVPIFMANCTGKYKVELAGAAGGAANNSSVVGGNVIQATKPENGQVITATINLKLGDIVTYGIGVRGSSPDRDHGGAGGSPDGKNGGTGIYGYESKVLVTSGGGGGGGSSTLYVNGAQILSANGGAGGKGGYLQNYRPGSGGAGGSKNLNMSAYSITSTNTNAGSGYVKITYIP